MINKFDKKEIEELLDDLEWFNGVDYTVGSNKKTIHFDIDLANKIFSGEIDAKEISETEYEELIYAINSVKDFCMCIANVDDPMLNKFLQALENSRKG